ncbi:MAG: sugar ABC transporter permease [Spirochaetaceae bacterium]|jgi:oligogalacturonide transport system permease protein|nr:sugar ABC transporter permease [Spirochaetaceae bacterium]
MKTKKTLTGLLYILPWLAGFCLLQFVPLCQSLWYSFTDFQLIGESRFVGIENFKKIFTADPQFWQSLKVTFLYVLIAVPLKIAFALFIAVVLNQKLAGINLFRTVYYMPSILGGSIAISVLWKFLFMKQGVINNIIGTIGIPAVDWLGSPAWALFTVSLVTIWQFGSSMVLFLAGLKQIPESLYEAARLDGAGRVSIFFRVTLPMLTPIVFFNLIMQMINAFQEFTTVFVITQGGPLKSTYLYGMMLYEQGFKYFRMGYASALSWILFAVIFIFTSLTFKSSESWVHYGDS